MKRWLRRGGRIAAMVAGLSALRLAGAVSIGEMAETGADDLAEIPALISILIYIAGVVFLGSGVLKLKRFNENSRDQGLGGAIMTMAVGAGLLALPSVFEGISDTFGVDDSATIEKPTLQ